MTGTIMEYVGNGIRKDIVEYVQQSIIPQYAFFDKAHREDHAVAVITSALRLLDSMPESAREDCKDVLYGKSGDWNPREMLFAAAACHDLGLAGGRENHHTDSGKIIRADAKLMQWFTPDQIETIAQAAEDHRASVKAAPRTIFGQLVAEADRIIDNDTIVTRCLLFGFASDPSGEKTKEWHIARCEEHIRKKYGRGGYIKLWIPWSDNAAKLSELQDIISDPEALHAILSKKYDRMKNGESE